MVRFLLFLSTLLVAWPHGLAAEDVVTLETGAGSIRFRLLADKAPAHVENFKKLARQGFYDGTTFHRTIPGYIIQGGSPTSKDGDSTNDNFGTPGYALKAEFNDVPHARGVVSMARDVNDPDSAGSQFFIVLGRAPELDAIRFTVFGQVIEGIEIADRIAAAPRDEANFDRPLQPVVVKSVKVETLTTSEPAASVPLGLATAAVTARSSPAPVAPVAAASPKPSAARISDERIRVASGVVNIRKSASTTAAVLQRLRAGTELKVLGREGDWISVSLADGAIGWVRQDTVEVLGR